MTHVIVVTYGEPPTPSCAAQLAYSWHILVGLTRTIAAIPRAALPFVALARAHTRGRLWRRWSYESPLEAITRLQAEALRRALAEAAPGEAWSTHVAYEFRHPRLPEVLEALPAAGAVCVVPMYVADSAFTHELSRQVVRRVQQDRSVPADGRRVCVLPALEPETLARISAEHVLRHVAADFRGPDVALVLAAHGTLLDPPRPLETGRAETERLGELIAARLRRCYGLVARGWLNHTRGGRWTEPPIAEALRHVRRRGFTKVAYFPYGFLADNAESQLEGRLALAAEPALQASVVPCLNQEPALAHALAAQVLSAVRGSYLTDQIGREYAEGQS